MNPSGPPEIKIDLVAEFNFDPAPSTQRAASGFVSGECKTPRPKTGVPEMRF
tara:strand:+ start:1357 stop:1512 length:156 start_codon:yes stop_codon:yes gene_type:complete